MKNYPEKVLQDKLKEVRATKDFVIVNNPKASLEDFNKIIKELEEAINKVNSDREVVIKEVLKIATYKKREQRSPQECKKIKSNIKLLLSKGLSVPEIASIVDCHPNYVYTQRKKINLNMQIN